MKKTVKKYDITAIISSLKLLALLLWSPTFSRCVITKPQTIHYSINVSMLGGSGRDVALEAAKGAFKMWEECNPGLVFEESEEGIKITFTDGLLLLDRLCGIEGIATRPFWKNSENRYHIRVSAYVLSGHPGRQVDKNRATNVLAHEIGHVFGFCHTSKKGHLMRGGLGLVLDWWNPMLDWMHDRKQTFVVPERRDSHGLGVQKLM